MSRPHPHPWHSASVFGDGPRRPLDRERKARYYFLLKIHRQARRLTPLGEHTGIALVRRLGNNGQCDPAHATVAEDVGCCERTVRRALATLKALGLVMWQRRIVRSGSCVDQVSNAYLLLTPDTNPTDGHFGRQAFKRKKYSSSLLSVPREPTDEEQDAMARVRAAKQIRLLMVVGAIPTTWGISAADLA